MIFVIISRERESRLTGTRLCQACIRRTLSGILLIPVRAIIFPCAALTRGIIPWRVRDESACVFRHEGTPAKFRDTRYVRALQEDISSGNSRDYRLKTHASVFYPRSASRRREKVALGKIHHCTAYARLPFLLWLLSLVFSFLFNARVHRGGNLK